MTDVRLTGRRHRVFKQLVKVLNGALGGRVLLFVFISVHISSVVIGAKYCAEPCHRATVLSIIILIKGCIGLVFWSFVGLLFCKKILEKSVDNSFFEVFTYLQYLFTSLLILTQTVWLSLFYAEIKRECPLRYWTATALLEFSIFITVMDLAVFITVVFFCCYNACEDNSDQ